MEEKERLGNMRERLPHVKVQAQTKEIEEMIESYIVQCEKALQTGKREDLPKYMQTKFADQKRDREKSFSREEEHSKSGTVSSAEPNHQDNERINIYNGTRKRTRKRK